MNQNQVERLRSLKRLLDQGALTPPQFEKLRTELLAESMGGRGGSSDAPVFLGRYRVGERLGQGGFGSVYRARHLDAATARRHGGDIALKVLEREAAADPMWRARFERETTLLSARIHPGIVQILDRELDASPPWYAMELVPGRPLEALIEDEVGPIPAQRAVPMFRALSAIVGTLHSAGVVHRDLKPDNVMVRPDGQLVLIDFGIAKAPEKILDTSTKGAFGSPFYMAPEQHYRAADADPQSDIYSLGMTLYQMLAGRLPFGPQDGLVDVFMAKQQGLQPPTVFYPHIPGELVDLVMWCLAPEPARRPQSVADLLTALEGGAGPRRVPAVEPSGPSLARRVPMPRSPREATDILAESEGGAPVTRASALLGWCLFFSFTLGLFLSPELVGVGAAGSCLLLVLVDTALHRTWHTSGSELPYLDFEDRMHPLLWLLACAAFFPLVFPWYLTRRRRIIEAAAWTRRFGGRK